MREIISDLIQPRGVLRIISPFGPHIRIVKAKEGHTKDAEHLKRDVGFQLRMIHRLPKPRTLKGWPAKRIPARPRKGVPIGAGKPQVVRQGFALQHLAGIVVTEGEFILRLWPFERDGGDVFEKVGHGGVSDM